MTNKFPIIVSLAVLAATFSAHAGSTHGPKEYIGALIGLPPQANYHELETKHFIIIYPRTSESDLDPVARDAGYFLEEAHRELSKVFQYEASHKVKIILIDNHDHANGLTSAVGHQGIILYVTSPEPYSSIGEYDHWLRGLIIHEYAHYLTLVQRRGFYEALGILTGELVYPNHLWPAWLAEGLAVYAESAYTRAGRGYGTFYETITRDGIATKRLGTDQFLAYDKIVGPVPRYPFGESYYYSGFAIVDELTHRFGDKMAAAYPYRSANRIPWFLNTTLRRVTDDRSITFQDLWQSWIKRQSDRLTPEIEWLEKHGTKEPEFFTNDEDSSIGARVSPNGRKLATIVTGSGSQLPGLEIVDIQTKKHNHVDDVAGGGQLAWSEDGNRVYYAKSDYNGPYDYFSEIYVYEVDRDRVRQVTSGERAKDPSVCGNSLVYTTDRASISQLRVYDLAKKSVRVLYEAPRYHHLANPRCVLDKGTYSVLFSKHTTEPLDAIYSISLAGGEPRHLAGGPAAGYGALFPDAGDNGSVIFTRVDRGYYEIASLTPATGRIERVARSAGGYWLPQRITLADGTPAYATSYISSRGLKAAILKTTAPVETSAPATDKPYSKLPPGEMKGQVTPTPLSPSSYPNRSYHLISSLVPRIWLPYIAMTKDQQQYGAAVISWDDVDQFEYTVGLWYDSVSKGADGLISTLYRFSTFDLGVAATREVTAYAYSGALRSYDEENKLSVTLARPFPGEFSSFIPALVAEWARTFRLGDFGSLAFKPDERVGFNLAYLNENQFAYSILPESGFNAALLGRRYFSGTDRAWKAYLSAEQLFQTLPARSSLSLRAYAAVTPTLVAAIPDSVVRVGGYPLASDLDIPLRGYKLGNFSAQRAAVLQTEYRFPIVQIFTGFGNAPIFIRNLGGYVFYDAAKLQRNTVGVSPLVSAAGTGFIANTATGYAYPLQLRLEYAHGFNKDLRGENIVSLRFGY